MSKILIIEDDPSNAELLASYIKLYGIEAIITYTGQAGFDIGQTLQPDLIFVDLRMPQPTWDGYKTIFELKTSTTTQHIPVIAITASGNPGKARAMGCDSILFRPFRTNQLKEILNQYMAIEQ